MASLATLPALAKMISVWMPELSGRVTAVTDAEVTRQNIPTLPLCMLALAKEENLNQPTSGNMNIRISETFIVEFWLPPERYKTAQGTESPFWAFYDYDTFRDQLVSRIHNWRSPRGAGITYSSLSMEVTELAVILTFRFRHDFKWCPIDNGDAEAQAPVAIVAGICRPVTNICPPSFDPQEDCETCP